MSTMQKSKLVAAIRKVKREEIAFGLQARNSGVCSKKQIKTAEIDETSATRFDSALMSNKCFRISSNQS